MNRMGEKCSIWYQTLQNCTYVITRLKDPGCLPESHFKHLYLSYAHRCSSKKMRNCGENMVSTCGWEDKMWGTDDDRDDSPEQVGCRGSVAHERRGERAGGGSEGASFETRTKEGMTWLDWIPRIIQSSSSTLGYCRHFPLFLIDLLTHPSSNPPKTKL